MIWVIERSGAEKSMKRSAIIDPVTPTAATADSRDRMRAHDTAPARASAEKTNS